MHQRLSLWTVKKFSEVLFIVQYQWCVVGNKSSDYIFESFV